MIKPTGVRKLNSHQAIHFVFSAGFSLNHSFSLRVMATQSCWSPPGTLLHFFTGTQYVHNATSIVYTPVEKKKRKKALSVEHRAPGTPSLLSFVFLNAPFYRLGAQTRLLLNFWHLFDAWIESGTQTWKIAVTGLRFRSSISMIDTDHAAQRENGRTSQKRSHAISLFCCLWEEGVLIWSVALLCAS